MAVTSQILIIYGDIVHILIFFQLYKNTINE